MTTIQLESQPRTLSAACGHPGTSRSPVTLFTAEMDFERYRHLLSKRPLNRPKRMRPLTSR